MKLTRAQIESKRTENGGYTRRQLAEWGIPWPPPKGWKARLTRGAEKKIIYKIKDTGEPATDKQLEFIGVLKRKCGLTAVKTPSLTKLEATSAIETLLRDVNHPVVKPKKPKGRKRKVHKLQEEFPDLNGPVKVRRVSE